MIRPAFLTVALLVPTLHAQVPARPYLDLVPFGELATWQESRPQPVPSARPIAAGANNLGVVWREERDVREVRVRFTGAARTGLGIEYWFRTWPYAPPVMPTIEDPVDDPWQGEWLRAETREQCEGSECRYTFQALRARENRLANNLPGVTYRRTLKVRVAGDTPLPEIAGLQVFSDSLEKDVSLRITLGQGSPPGRRWSGSAAVSNGRLKQARTWKKGLLVDLTAADPQLPGSLDSTIVTVRAVARARSGEQPYVFSFNLDDLKNGPIYIPAVYAYVTNASDPPEFRPPTGRGPRIRTRIPAEPEQTYERASREIPPLDPWQRQNGGRVYLPLAADASWQKFAVEYGGNIFVSKREAKIKGNELARVQWSGDRITWKLGTGERPYYRDDRASAASILDNYLPVVIQQWENQDLRYTEEAFATLLRGPLSPRDPGRSEQTPAILMVRLTARNESAETRTAHFWLSLEPAESLHVSGRQVRGAAGQLRAVLDAPAAVEGGAAHVSLAVPARGAQTLVVKLPFVTDLNQADAGDLEKVSYDTERARVVAYWKTMVNETVRFTTPEPRFDHFARAVVPHIHISATKDPRSGLYMVPAASYAYQVFANETCFQVLLLDVLGDHKTAAEYLETLLQLQGSRNFPGLHKGPPDAIFHGARVDQQYDYTASNYGLDHGTVLWTLAEHYLYSRDRAWLERNWPRMRKAIDWIEEQRATTRLTDTSGARVKEYGLMPASHLEDNSDWANWFAINAFCWAGMDRSAWALADLGHRDAARIRAQADAYRQELRDAVQRAWEAAPVAQLRDGTYAPHVPVEPHQRFRRFGPKRIEYYQRYGKSGVMPTFRLSATREVLYGPIILLNLGLFAPGEPVADWILDDWEDNQTLTSGMGMNVHGVTDDALWFSQGGMVFQSNLQNPILVYLMRRETPAAIRSLYNNFVACLYPDVTAFTEEYRMWRHASGPFYKSPDEARFVNRLRDALVLEQGDTLWLGSGIPRRWLAGTPIVVQRLDTWFGPVAFRIQPGQEGGTVDAELRLPSSPHLKHVRMLARPPQGRISAVTVNGHPWTSFDPGSGTIDLPLDAASVLVRFR